uniref:Uncharacterized protein n=1 Tax=Athene cunicularia TaxID=194338 RepID=A0A663MZ17_ATHCN
MPKITHVQDVVLNVLVEQPPSLLQQGDQKASLSIPPALTALSNKLKEELKITVTIVHRLCPLNPFASHSTATLNITAHSCCRGRAGYSFHGRK